MKKIRSSVLCLTFILGLVANSVAQSLVQPLNVSLTAYDARGHRTVKIGTKDLIRYFAGTDVPDARLFLVTPVGNTPGTTGNLNAFLRIKSGAATVLDITSPNEFNFYQDVATLKTNGVHISAHAINRFSIDNGGVRAELQGISTWSVLRRLLHGDDTGGAGSFHSSVNGWLWIYNVTESMVPIRGSIVGGRPLLDPGS
jgi:hypothetical protein